MKRQDVEVLRRLWDDESGATLSSETILVASILVIGVIVGLKSVRDAVLTELADVANSVANLSQSYSYSGVDGHATNASGAFFEDAGDFCDTAESDDNSFSGNRCVNVCVDSDVEP